MPIYEYHCEKCQHDFEVLVSGSAQPECPKCHARRLTKKFSTFSASGTQHKVGSSHTHTPTCGCGRNPGTCGFN